jgi:hypothetical protein
LRWLEWGRILAVVILAGCASRSGAPIESFSSPDARSEWIRLQQVDRSLRGARALVQIRMSGAGTVRSFRAIFRTDSDRRVLIDVLTPIGTTALTLFLDGDQATSIDYLHGRYWKGSAASLPGAPPFFSLGSSRRVAALLLGLPTGEGAASEDNGTIKVSGEGFDLVVTPSGISHVTIHGALDELTADYDPPHFPASSFRIASSSTPVVVTATVAEIESAEGRIEMPAIPPGYMQAVPEL